MAYQILGGPISVTRVPLGNRDGKRPSSLICKSCPTVTSMTIILSSLLFLSIPMDQTHITSSITRASAVGWSITCYYLPVFPCHISTFSARLGIFDGYIRMCSNSPCLVTNPLVLANTRWLCARKSEILRRGSLLFIHVCYSLISYWT